MGKSDPNYDKMGEQHCSMSSSSIHVDHCEMDGPAESKGNMATEKLVDGSLMERLKVISEEGGRG